jgi:hypothetical protein
MGTYAALIDRPQRHTEKGEGGRERREREKEKEREKELDQV